MYIYIYIYTYAYLYEKLFNLPITDTYCIANTQV